MFLGCPWGWPRRSGGGLGRSRRLPAQGGAEEGGVCPVPEVQEF